MKLSAPYGEPVPCGLCYDAYCITLHGRSYLLLVHFESRHAAVRFGLSPVDWSNIKELDRKEIRLRLLEAGTPKALVTDYMDEAGEEQFTRTHVRREVAFLNRAWEEVLFADLLTDQSSSRQPMLNSEVSSHPCRCAEGGRSRHGAGPLAAVF